MKNSIAQRLFVESCIAISILFVAAIIGVLLYFKGQSKLLRFFEWLEELGVWASSLD